MGEKIKRHFVEDRVVVIDPLPFTWRVKGPGPHYCLDMKMSRLKQLAFAFEFGSVDPRQSFPVTEFPARIVKLDISLNELEELQPEALFAFESLSELDASLNALGGIPGIGVLPNLTVLNLSYNVLSDVRDLGSCTHLLVLNLSHNQVRTLEHMPLLSNLTRLHLGSNKLSSLEGVQNLPQLCELYIQRNRVSSLLPLSSSLVLNILDASSNKIACLQYTLHVLRGLGRLRHLKLQGNPLARDNCYATAIKQATAVETLDDVLLRDPPRCSALSSFSWALLGESVAGVMNSSQTKEDLKTSARRIFLERLQHKRDDTESAVHHLHSRILDLREDLAEYEDTLKTEMDGCIRYIDALPPKHFQGLTNPDTIPNAMEKFLFTKFWQRWQQGQRKPANLPYKALTKPDEVLQAAAQLLSNPPPGDADA
ncbi:adenylate cyclase-like [Alligator sinensis]|uniref:Adenylate cyclase-like n=1 Tax=Alligator sinensis TaxID=38654 RepID=A0A3Q0H994_ALLSI|nr:adenylate cyclase-like [Alligator sinensis]